MPCADTHALFSHNDHRGVITRDWRPGPVLIFVPLHRTVITAEWSQVTSVQGLCWSSCLFIAQRSPQSDHMWLSRVCADPRASSSHRDHCRVIPREACRYWSLCLCIEKWSEWSHVTGVQGLCWSSAKYFHLTSRGTRNLPVGMRRLPLFLTTKKLTVSELYRSRVIRIS